jgi:hypothetical protein
MLDRHITDVVRAQGSLLDCLVDGRARDAGELDRLRDADHRGVRGRIRALTFVLRRKDQALLDLRARRDVARDLIEVGASNPLVDAGVPASAGEPGPSAVRPSATTNEIEEIRNLFGFYRSLCAVKVLLAVLRSTSDCARFANKRSVSVRAGDQSLS